MSAGAVPVAPGGLRPGQLGLIVVGRVIMGDIAVTVADLAQRGFLAVDEAADDRDWLLSPSGAGAPGQMRGHVLEYERRLLDGLAEAGAPARLSALPSGFGKTLDETREALVREAVRQGWLRRLHHGRRSPKGEDLAQQVRFFRRDLRRLKADGGQDSLTGAMLPYVLHFGLMPDAQLPLARFARAWVHAFADLPGWAPPKPKDTKSDDPIAPATDPGDRMARQMEAAAFIMGAM